MDHDRRNSSSPATRWATGFMQVAVSLSNAPPNATPSSVMSPLLHPSAAASHSQSSLAERAVFALVSLAGRSLSVTLAGCGNLIVSGTIACMSLSWGAGWQPQFAESGVSWSRANGV